MKRLYIAVLDEFPDFMTPTLVAHSMLGAHISFSGILEYEDWLNNSFRKCVVRVGQKEFDKISRLDRCYLGHENKTLDGRKSCAIPLPYDSDGEIPNVLRYAKLWKPKEITE